MQEQKRSNSIDQYSQYWKKKIQKRNENLKQRKKELIRYARNCSELLKREFGVDKVFLIGSLARDYRINEKTDIDLVVSGLPSKEYFSALNKLYKLVPKGVDIDLITEEKAADFVKTKIKNEGIEL